MGQRKNREQRRAEQRSGASQPGLRQAISGEGWAASVVPGPRLAVWDCEDDDDWGDGDISDVDFAEMQRQVRAAQEAPEAPFSYTIFRIGVEITDRDLAQKEIDRLVPVALAQGAPWSALADVFGVTRQSLQKRYRQREVRAD